MRVMDTGTFTRALHPRRAPRLAACAASLAPTHAARSGARRAARARRSLTG